MVRELGSSCDTVFYTLMVVGNLSRKTGIPANWDRLAAEIRLLSFFLWKEDGKIHPNRVGCDNMSTFAFI